MKKTVLITGASTGIGRATATLFAESGWNVVATMRKPEAATDLASLQDVLVTRLDVQDQESIDQAIAAGIARFARIDAVINNAGFSLSGVFESIPREKIREQFDVNVFGIMDVTRAVLPHFRANGGGTIINVSSRAGLVGLPMISLYCASKYALEGFSESLAFELASQNVTVKIVEPSGGISSTNFGERMSSELSRDANLTDYDDFITHTSAIYAATRAARQTTAGDVAKVIHEAATDGTTQLRYFVGEDVGGLVEAKRTMRDQQYADFVRARFQP